MRTDAARALAGLLGTAALAVSAAPATAAAVHDDPLEFHVVISTEQGGQRRTLLRRAKDDVHLRALVERDTGAVSFEVHKTVAYHDLHARDFRLVHYASPDGLQRAEVRRVHATAAGCAAADLPAACTMREEVAFVVDEALLRRIAASPADASAAPWRLRFKATRGDDVDSAVHPAEVARLLAAVDDYQSRRTRAVAMR